MAAMDAETWQMNVEELLALQSILQSSLDCFIDGIQHDIDDDRAEQLMEQGCCGRRLSVKAEVHTSAPDGGLTVQVKASTGSDDSMSSAELRSAAATSHIQHLPPICLELIFPDTYPLQDPPGMMLSAEWLSSEQADSLAQQLLELWREQALGGPICFTWTDWLQNDALAFMGITDRLLLTFNPLEFPSAQSSHSSLAAEEHELHEPSQSAESKLSARESASRSEASADNMQSNGKLGQQLADNGADSTMPKKAVTSGTKQADSREPAGAQSTHSAQSASRTNGKHVAYIGGEESGAGSSSNARSSQYRRPGRLRQKDGSQSSPAKALDLKATVWQPPGGSKAASLPEPSTEKANHSLQHRTPTQAQQSEEKSSITESPASVLLGSKAEQSHNSSSAQPPAEEREGECTESAAVSATSREKESVDSVAADSSRSGTPQTLNSESDMERVVKLYMHLTAYSKSRERELFQEGQHACGICMEDLPGASFVWPGGCDHAYCKDCVKQLCSLHVAEGGLENLCCPQPDCKQPFNRQCLMGLLDEEQLQRWEDLELTTSLQKMPDVVYCPRCSSACVEDAENCAQCSKCFLAFCSLCNESWHPGTECMNTETKLELLRRRMAGMSVSVAELRRKELEYMSLVRIQETSKRCPACGMAIQKSAGCNKMTCGNCGAYFCWRCNKEVDGYDHFQSGKCILFDHAEIQRWEVELQVQIERAQAQARNAFWADVGERRRSKTCPSCGQANHKINDNNHMRCWACTAHFCYLCRQRLRGTKGASGSHFGKAGSGKCRQHSPD